MKKRFNAETGRFDWVLTEAEVTALCLKLIQDPDNPQVITGGAPVFSEGVTFYADKPVYFDGGL